MNPVTKALQMILGIIRNLPEEHKKAIDVEIDKLEDKFKEGSIRDVITETACRILRGIIGVPDYPDEEKKDKEEVNEPE